MAPERSLPVWRSLLYVPVNVGALWRKPTCAVLIAFSWTWKIPFPTRKKSMRGRWCRIRQAKFRAAAPMSSLE